MIHEKLPSNRPVHAAGGEEGRRVAGLCLGLAVLTLTVFGQTLGCQFVNFDDAGYVYENPVVARGLTLKGLLWAFSFHCDNWHPLTWLSHELDCQLYGLRPGGHHLTNVLLHTATVVLLFRLLRRMTGALWRSALVAAVFAIHPLRVESVAWVAERKDVLSGLFFVLTLGAYVRYAENLKFQISNFKFHYALALVFFVCGLMSKPMVVALPLVLLLLDYWPLQRKESARRLVMEKAPFLALSAAACVVTLFAQTGAEQSIESFPLRLRLANALASCMIYLGQMVFPAGLAVFYPYAHNGLPAWEVALAATLLAGLSGVAWARRRTQPWMLVGWLWYLLMLLPVLGVFQVGEQAHADRYTYLPQIGIYVALTWLAAEWSAKWHVGRAVIGSLMAGVVGALMICAWKQTSYWKTNEILWRHAVDCTSGNYLALNNLGVALDHDATVDEAIALFQKAVQIDPRYAMGQFNLGNALLNKGHADEAIEHYQRALEIWPGYAEAHNNLANAILPKGQVDEAMAHYQTALKLKADYAQAHLGLGTVLLQKGKVDEAIAQYQLSLQINPGYAEAHYNLGLAFLQKGSVDDAIAQFQESLRLKPDNAEAHGNLANVLLQKGKADEAMAHYQAALQLKPDSAEEHVNFGAALLQMGRAPEAIAQFQKTLQLQPDNPQALNSLAWLLATSPEASLRNGNKAVQLAQRANELAGGNNPAVLRTLAAAFAEAGKFDEAKRIVQQAIELTRTVGRQDWAQQLNKELLRYQAGRPLHP
jgi:tetratricopeptide (TPR) repeat protein